MGTVTAASLLSTYRIKLSPVAGRSRPAFATDFMRKLVAALEVLEPSEQVDIRVRSENPIHAEFVRMKTGELLAQLVEPSDRQTGGQELTLPPT